MSRVHIGYIHISINDTQRFEKKNFIDFIINVIHYCNTAIVIYYKDIKKE